MAMLEVEEQKRSDRAERYRQTLAARMLTTEILEQRKEDERLYLRMAQPEQAVRGLG